MIPHRSLRVIGYILAIFLTYGIVKACVQAVVASNTNTATIQYSDADKANFNRQFMSRCDTGELTGTKFSQASYCQCVLDSMVTNYGYTAMSRDGLNMSSTDAQVKYKPEISACLKQQGIDV